MYVKGFVKIHKKSQKMNGLAIEVHRCPKTFHCRKEIRVGIFSIRQLYIEKYF